MNATQMSDEIAVLNARTKAIWPHGFASVVNIGDHKWSVCVYDDNLDAKHFAATTAEGAFHQARDYFDGNQVMTEARLATILGVENAVGAA